MKATGQDSLHAAGINYSNNIVHAYPIILCLMRLHGWALHVCMTLCCSKGMIIIDPHWLQHACQCCLYSLNHNNYKIIYIRSTLLLGYVVDSEIQLLKKSIKGYMCMWVYFPMCPSRFLHGCVHGIIDSRRGKRDCKCP